MQNEALFKFRCLLLYVFISIAVSAFFASSVGPDIVNLMIISFPCRKYFHFHAMTSVSGLEFIIGTAYVFRRSLTVSVCVLKDQEVNFCILLLSANSLQRKNPDL